MLGGAVITDGVTVVQMVYGCGGGVWGSGALLGIRCAGFARAAAIL